MSIRSGSIGTAFCVIAFVAVSAALGVEKKNGDDLQEMEITALGFDQVTQTPIVILTDKKKETVLPIWIGLCEARSIEIGLSGAIPPRPLTYDLVAAMVRTLNAEVKRIVITDLRDQVFYAQVVMSVNGKVSNIDARPSDAIALASRMKSPIFVDKSVIRKAALSDSGVLEREL
ncbi:MAG TPA: bifunctional nuclease family protein [Thermodesulfobacteriota bacterium]|nr:bifunctional nuclease family protein [Thermodesulfobacteriota bacterium]